MPTNLTNIPVADIRALADERERYEGWIAALTSRRGHTPPHVYERVQQDYNSRLASVMGRLGEHLVALREGETFLAERDDVLARSLVERQDELAEVELRTLVGEYDADTGARLRDDKAAEVRGLESERADVDAELTTVRDLLTRSAPPDAAATAPRGARVPVAGGVTGAASESMDGPTAANSSGLPANDAEGRPAASDGVGQMNRTAERPPASAGWAPDAGRDAAAPRVDQSGVGRSAPTDAASVTFATAGMPEPEKTLRCQDCGAMNYPTEWYCERCGGELAAL